MTLFRGPVFVLVTLLLAGSMEGLAGAEPPTGIASTRETRPLTVAAAVNAVMPSAGLDVSYQLGSRFAVGAQLTTLVVHYDLSLRSRLFLVAGRRSGLYAGLNLHGWYSPLILSRPTRAATLELGYELRDDSGFTLGVGVGGGVIRLPEGSEGAGTTPRWSPLPLLNVRVGRSW